MKLRVLRLIAVFFAPPRRSSQQPVIIEHAQRGFIVCCAVFKNIYANDTEGQVKIYIPLYVSMVQILN